LHGVINWTMRRAAISAPVPLLFGWFTSTIRRDRRRQSVAARSTLAKRGPASNRSRQDRRGRQRPPRSRECPKMVPGPAKFRRILLHFVASGFGRMGSHMRSHLVSMRVGGGMSQPTQSGGLRQTRTAGKVVHFVPEQQRSNPAATTPANGTGGRRCRRQHPRERSRRCGTAVMLGWVGANRRGCRSRGGGCCSGLVSVGGAEGGRAIPSAASVRFRSVGRRGGGAHGAVAVPARRRGGRAPHPRPGPRAAGRAGWTRRWRGARRRGSRRWRRSCRRSSTAGQSNPSHASGRGRSVHIVARRERRAAPHHGSSTKRSREEMRH
jgi:hypothetical protein